VNIRCIQRIVSISSLSFVASFVIAASANSATSEEYRRLEERVKILEHKQHEEMKNKPVDPVLALPQVNLRDKYNTAGVYNQDLAMLKMRRIYDCELRARCITPLPYPRIELGGSIIGLGTVKRPPNVPPINGRTQSDLNLSGANIDLNGDITDAVLGNIRISYDPNPPEKIADNSIITRVSASRIFLNTAFITWGDLNRVPFYLTAGQLFLPFGEYNTSMLSAPLTARVGRMRQRPILLGYQSQAIPGLNAQVFGFKGDSFIGLNSGTVDNGGANVAYTFSIPFVKVHTGASYVNNIADAGGMQNTGPSTIVTDAGEFVDNEFLDEHEDIDVQQVDAGPLTTFRGFGANESIVHRVPAWNARGKLDLLILPISLYGEVVTPTRMFAPENLTFNDVGAKPRAWHGEGSYRFLFFDIPTTIAASYGRSSQALALNMPLWASGAAVRMKFKKVITCSIGYQYEKAYPIDSIATGQELPVNANRFVGARTRTWSGQINARF
jgi:hypothetical protein